MNMRMLFGVVVVVLTGCASTSAGDAPLLEETLSRHCPTGAVKECVVTGGNRVWKRIEYCGCRPVGMR